MGNAVPRSTESTSSFSRNLPGMSIALPFRRMTRPRIIFLNFVFVAFIAGSAYDLVTDQEHWPFSQYPMFSGVWRSPTFKWLRLYGVNADGNEFPLDANAYVTPFDQSRLPKAL